jgi:GT2 family glycosyltransferase
MSKEKAGSARQQTPPCDLRDERCLVSIVIPNWNGMRFLDVCLASLDNQTNKNFETIVVDNGSSDGSVEYLKENYPNVQTMALKRNTGFSKAANIGILAARGDLVFLLNNDTEVDHECVKEILAAADCYPNDSFFCCKMVNYYHRDILDSAGDFLPKSLNPFSRGEMWKDSEEFKLSQHTFGACAGAAVYKRNALIEVGMFDEDFFAYYEDVDLSMRLQLAGYTCRYIPEAVVYHLGSATTGSTFNPFIAQCLARNKCFLLIKNMTWALIWTNCFDLIWGEVFRSIQFVKQKCAVEYIKGIFEAFIKLPKMIKKRKQILGSAKVSNEYIQKIMDESEQWIQPDRIVSIPPR